MVPVRAAENLKRRAEAQLAVAETAFGFATSAEEKEQVEGAKAQAVARIAELEAQWTAPRRSSNRSSMPSRLRASGRRRRERADRGSGRGAPGGARVRAGIGVDQPQNPAALCPASL